MPLDPQVKPVLDALNAIGLGEISTQTPEAIRRLYAGQTNLLPGEPMAAVANRAIPGPAGEIPVRVYTPREQHALPGLVFFHGGGWVIGNLETHDATCRRFAKAIGCTVVSVDYRLAPEHPFPAAVEDCFAATRWVAERAEELGIDPGRLAVGGDSAGGNLAAVVALMARDRGGPPLVHQLLLYPITDHDFETHSYRENAEGLLLTRASMIWFWDHYLRDASRRADPHASPLRAPDLAGLPPALVVTAEFDPLRDEGEAYAGRLEEARVPTRCVRYGGMVHGFLSFADVLDRGRQAVAEIGEAMRAAFKR